MRKQSDRNHRKTTAEETAQTEDATGDAAASASAEATEEEADTAESEDADQMAGTTMWQH